VIYVDQIRAARAALKWQQSELSERSSVSIPTIKRIEGGTGPVKANYDTVTKLVDALEKAGIQFIDDAEKPGVLWKGPKQRELL